MYCILVAGMPAAGKSTIAKTIAEKLNLPIISKDSIKEYLFDNVGFRSRAEKVNLGIASMKIMDYVAGQLMKAGQSFILENNFEYSECGIKKLLEEYQYPALTITLTGDYKIIYQRFMERENSPDRHRGHVVNDCYPEKKERSTEEAKAPTISYEDYVCSLERRGFDAFAVGEQIKVDTSDFAKIDMEKLFSQIAEWKEKILKPYIHIRPYQEADFERMCRIHDPARRNELALAGLADAFLPLSIAAWREGLFDYHVYVAEWDGLVAGFVAFTEDEIAWLYVDVEYSRRGIGRELLRYAMQFTNDEVSIEVLVGNTPAVTLYSSLGFVIEETVSGKMPGNEAFPVTVYVMKKVKGKTRFMQ